MTDIIKKQKGDRETQANPVLGGKIIDREVIVASDEAKRIIDEARAEAAGIIASSEAAREASRREGRTEGYETGMAQWIGECRKVRDALRELVDGSKPELIRLALRVAEKILRQKIEASPDSIVPMIEDALKSVRAQQQSRIIMRVHPDDIATLESRKQRWIEKYPSISSLEVLPEETLKRGGCRLETDFGMVDATLETQLRVIERHLLGDLASK